jgi:hypothetical protein
VFDSVVELIEAATQRCLGCSLWGKQLSQARTQPTIIAAGAFYEAFKPERARALVRRIEFCHTPKHGSWLNIAENELSSLTRQCVSDRRFENVETLRTETQAWSNDVNATQRGVDWQMEIGDARTKLKSVYPTTLPRPQQLQKASVMAITAAAFHLTACHVVK